MRIAWCTPFMRRSAIGRVSSLIVEELLRLAEVDVWYPRAEDAIGTSGARTIPLTSGPADIERLAAYDFAVYNMGNHPGNHREIFEVSRQVPGVMILHDLVLQDFFCAYYLSQAELRDRYTAAVRRWYGPNGLAAVRELTAGISCSFLKSPAVLEFPLFEEAIAGSYGVVTHSRESAERVRRVFPGLVRYLPLPYDVNRGARVPSRDRIRVPDGRMLAVTIGDVNPNKRIQTVIEALGKNPLLAARIFYVVLGEAAPDYQVELIRLVQQYGLQDIVSLVGYVTEEQLSAYLTYADFCINLRYPATETASASAIEELFYGKPIIVSNTGSCRDFPDDCVLKVRTNHEEEDLVSALRRLIDDHRFRRQLGERAPAYARETFRADRYARCIVELGEELLDSKPLFAFTDRIAKELGRMGVSSDLPTVSSVATAAAALFGSEPP